MAAVCTEDCFRCPYDECRLDKETRKSISESKWLDERAIIGRVREAQERKGAVCSGSPEYYWRHHDECISRARQYYLEHREERKAYQLARYYQRKERGL